MKILCLIFLVFFFSLTSSAESFLYPFPGDSTMISTIKGIAASSLDSFSFQVNTVTAQITFTFTTNCSDATYVQQGSNVVATGNVLSVQLSAAPAGCTGLSVLVNYPESVATVCTNSGKEYCADSYYRSIPADAPANFLADSAGYVYDTMQGLMWTASPLPTNYTNPSCCGQGPDGDQPYVNAAASACAAIGAGWRLATRSEHHRLMDHLALRPALNSAFFTVPAYQRDIGFWTSSRSPVQDYILNAYVIYATDGGVTYDGDVPKVNQGAFCTKTIVNKLRPVGGQYVVSPSGLSVHDSYTGIVWTQAISSTMYPGPGIADALAYCASLNVDGFTDWRLPAIKELVSLHSDFERGPLWNQTVFQTTGSGNYFWWASTPNNQLPGYYWAWTDGDGVAYINVNQGKARCIRGASHVVDSVFLSSSPTSNITAGPIPTATGAPTAPIAPTEAPVSEPASGLTGGQIAGIVIGVLIGVALLLAILALVAWKFLGSGGAESV